MATSSESASFEQGIRPLMEILIPGRAEAILGFQPDPQLQARIDDLAEKSTEGLLTEAERDEYAGFIRANKFVAILKRQARHLVNDSSVDDHSEE